MGKTILFSPVGGTDPISASNCKDGSLLHICRVYKPDIVYMYMSYEMLENQKKDDRYRYCLNRLCDLQKRQMEYHIIERPQLVNVQEFDYFYNEFRSIIVEIMRSMDESDTLLLNISSGTPGMKSGLLVLMTLGEFQCKSIQVTTPEKSINEHHHKDYDVETLWELNEDNLSEFENRCKEVQCPTLSVIKKEEIVKKHVQAYNYSAAVEVAMTLPRDISQPYYELVQMAEARALLDFKTAEKLARNNEIDCFPVKSGNEKKYFEYALNLDVKLRRKEYVDFIRGITPIIADVLELILKHEVEVNIDEYCYYTKDGVRRWNEKKLKGTKVFDALTKNIPNFDFRNIYSIHLVMIINELAKDANLKILVQELRSVEENVRNLAAHEIISVTEEVIVSKTKFTPKAIMEKIKQSFKYAGINIKKEYWNSYDDMNKAIIERMDR